jgi:hypothetical protein
MSWLAWIGPLGLALLPACDASDGCPPESGTVADVTTQPGRYPGYDVTFAEDPAGTWTATVTGTGSVRVSEWPAPAICEFVDHLELSLGLEFPSLQAFSGTTEGCAGWTSIWIYGYDWRDVDGVLAMTGAWMRARDYQFAVTLEIGGPFCVARG